MLVGKRSFWYWRTAGDAEDGEGVVLAGYVDLLACREGAEAVEHRRAAGGRVEESFDDRGAQRAGALEYWYQAASFVSGLLSRGGTWMVPSGLSPTSNTFECTPMAGMAIDTGADGVITVPWAAGVVTAGVAGWVMPEDAGSPPLSRATACCWTGPVVPYCAVEG